MRNILQPRNYYACILHVCKVSTEKNNNICSYSRHLLMKNVFPSCFIKRKSIISAHFASCENCDNDFAWMSVRWKKDNYQVKPTIISFCRRISTWKSNRSDSQRQNLFFHEDQDHGHDYDHVGMLMIPGITVTRIFHLSKSWKTWRCINGEKTTSVILSLGTISFCNTFEQHGEWYLTKICLYLTCNTMKVSKMRKRLIQLLKLSQEKLYMPKHYRSYLF